MTYTELEKCIPSISLAKQIINYSTILIFSYACSLLTLTGAFLIATRIPYTHLYNKANNVTLSTASFQQQVGMSMNKNDSQVLINGNLLGTNELNENQNLDFIFDIDVDNDENVDYVGRDCENCIKNVSNSTKNIDFQFLKNWKKYSNNDNSMNCSFEAENVFWPPLAFGKNFNILWFTTYS